MLQQLPKHGSKVVRKFPSVAPNWPRSGAAVVRTWRAEGVVQKCCVRGPGMDAEWLQHGAEVVRAWPVTLVRTLEARRA
eukprot:7949165-Pyramimonas_sp.AAC.1